MQLPDDRKQERTWWNLFPFRGIDITDRRHDLRRPLFGDVTLLSVRHLPHVIAAMKLDKEPGYDSDDIARHFKAVAERERAKTFLAVRRKGIVDDFEGSDEDPLIVYKAKERAYEVAGLLAVVFLTQSKYRTTCGLAEQIHTRPENLSLLDVEDGGYWVRTTGEYSISPFSTEMDEPLSRVRIKKLLFGAPFKVLAEIVLSKKSTLQKSLQRAVKQAILRLADAIHTPSPSAQLLGAVTTLEILFTINEGEKYEITRQRIIALLGLEAADHYDMKPIFHARHLYVHQGQEVADEAVPYRAVILALSCLLYYAKSVVTFSDKPDFIRYLDFVYKAEQLYPHWDDTRRKNFTRLLKHDRAPLQLPFGPFP